VTSIACRSDRGHPRKDRKIVPEKEVLHIGNPVCYTCPARKTEENE